MQPHMNAFCTSKLALCQKPSNKTFLLSCEITAKHQHLQPHGAPTFLHPTCCECIVCASVRDVCVTMCMCMCVCVCVCVRVCVCEDLLPSLMLRYISSLSFFVFFFGPFSTYLVAASSSMLISFVVTALLHQCYR